MKRRKITRLALRITALLVVSLMAVSTGKIASAFGERPGIAFQPDTRPPILGMGSDAILPRADEDLSCRYGAAAFGTQQPLKLATLRAGWYVNFVSFLFASTTESEFVPIIRVLQNKQGCTYLDGYTTTPPLTEAGLGAMVAMAPGSLWIVGNEPDRGPNPEDRACVSRVQDDTHPAIYARAYHDVYWFIKSHDPTARVANAGLVQVTPGRLDYLNQVWNTYLSVYGQPMPVDVWNMHLYILPEALPSGAPNGIANIALGTDPALAIRESGGSPNNCASPGVYCWAEHDDIAEFAKQIVAMRRWMADHGQRNKALILSEYSVLYPFEDYDDPVNPSTCHLQDEYGKCFTQTRVLNFMRSSLEYLETATDPDLGYPRDENHLVQRWLWFSVNHSGVGYVSDLYTDDLMAPTLLGNEFRDRAATTPASVNLYPAMITGRTDPAPSASASFTATLSVDVSNMGAVRASDTFTVTFFADSELTQLIDSVTVPGGVVGCESRSVSVSVKWAGLGRGEHRYWVHVDSGQTINETNEQDNVGSGVFFLRPERISLPLVRRR